MNVDPEDGESILVTKEMLKNKPKFDIPYKVMQPAQVKQVIKGEGFDYTKYFHE